MVLSAAPEQIHCTESCDWMRDCSFSRCILSIHWSGYSIACWLHGWCPVKLLSWCRLHCLWRVCFSLKVCVIISTGQIFKGCFNFLLGTFKVNYVHRMKVWRMNLRSSCMNMHVLGGAQSCTELCCDACSLPLLQLFCVHFFKDLFLQCSAGWQPCQLCKLVLIK